MTWLLNRIKCEWYSRPGYPNGTVKEVGAATVDVDQIQLHPTVHVEGANAVLITEGLR